MGSEHNDQARTEMACAGACTNWKIARTTSDAESVLGAATKRRTFIMCLSRRNTRKEVASIDIASFACNQTTHK